MSCGNRAATWSKGSIGERKTEKGVKRRIERRMKRRMEERKER